MAGGTTAHVCTPVAQAHIVRAMLEAMCFQTREVVDTMCHDAGLERLEVRPEPIGSMRARSWRSSVALWLRPSSGH